MPAGYGVAEFRVQTDTNSPAPTFPLEQLLSHERPSGPRGELTWATVGMVEDDPDAKDFIGAEAQTNNTGELTALYWALQRAKVFAPKRGGTYVWTDSLYAMNMTTGTWLPRKKRCRALVSSLRREWRELQRARPGEVKLRHVRSHIKVPGNELADYLAEMRPGGKSEAARIGLVNTDQLMQRSAQWLQEWLTAAEQTVPQRCRRAAPPEGARTGGASSAATDRGPGSLGDATGEG